jgi:hypothetical protein
MLSLGEGGTRRIVDKPLPTSPCDFPFFHLRIFVLLYAVERVCVVCNLRDDSYADLIIGITRLAYAVDYSSDGFVQLGACWE